jgi:4-hydroxybenzoyl-CoA reductase subunit beta
MLRLPPFQLLRPTSLEDAARLLVEEGATEGAPVRVVAGGTDLWPNMKRRHQKAAKVITLMGIPSLAGVHNGDGDGLRIGATTLLDDVARHPHIVARYPALATAVASISSPPLRNMGTLGGNVCVDTRCTYYNQTEEWRRSIDYCMKEEGHICWVATSSPRCWAHTASDSAPMLCVLGATVRLTSQVGERELPIADLYRDDGIQYLAKQPGEILTQIALPAAAARQECRSAFWKLRRRGSIDFAVLSVAAAVWTDAAGTVTRAKIYLGAVASAPTAADAAAALLVGQPLTAVAGDPELLAAAGRLVRKTVTPMDNTDYQAQWRGVMAARYTEAALRQLAGGDPQRLSPRHPQIAG